MGGEWGEWGEWGGWGGMGGEWGGMGGNWGEWGNSGHRTWDAGCGGLWRDMAQENGTEMGSRLLDAL